MFSAQSTESNKDGLTSGIMAINANVYEYKIRPRTLGGGLPSYLNYAIPIRLQSDENGAYSITNITASQVQLRAVSSMNASWIAGATIDSVGKATITYSGW